MLGVEKNRLVVDSMGDKDAAGEPQMNGVAIGFDSCPPRRPVRAPNEFCRKSGYH